MARRSTVGGIDSDADRGDAPAVYCSHTEMRAIDLLVPHPMNPNTHPPAQVELLAKIISAQGWRAPITVSERSGFVVRGHGRLMAAQHLGLEEVPVDSQPYETEAEEYADLVADNRIAELAEIDEEQLTKTLRSIGDMGFDLEIAGFDIGALGELDIDLNNNETQEAEPPSEFPEVGEEIETDKQCPKCGYRWS